MNSVIAQIQQWIVQNGNKEITANVLRPILLSMVEQPNGLIGDLTTLGTTNTNTLVSAINEILASQGTGEGVTIHTGTNNPNTTPPVSFNLTDYYVQTSGGATVVLWQFNDLEWVKIEKLNIKANSLFIPIEDWSLNLEDQIRDYINSTGLTVSSEILYLYGLKPLQSTNLAFQKYVWTWTLGNGTFNAQNPITSEDLFFISNTFNNTSTQIIDLGEIQANLIEEIVNISGPFALTYGSANAFKVLRSGIETFYLYFGNEEFVGLNEYQTNADEYIEISNFQPSEDVTDKLDRGGYTGSAQDLDTRITSLENEPNIDHTYLTIAAMIAGQNDQWEDDIIKVLDASEDGVTGRAYYFYNGTIAGTMEDYTSLTSQEVAALTAQAIIDALGEDPRNVIEQINTSDGTALAVVGKVVTLPEIGTGNERTIKPLANTTQYTLIAADFTDFILDFTANAGGSIQVILNAGVAPLNGQIQAISSGNNFLVPTAGTGVTIVRPEGTNLKTTSKGWFGGVVLSTDKISINGNLESTTTSVTDNELKVYQIPLASLTAVPTDENIQTLVAEWLVANATEKLDIQTIGWEVIEGGTITYTIAITSPTEGSSYNEGDTILLTSTITTS